MNRTRWMLVAALALAGAFACDSAVTPAPIASPPPPAPQPGRLTVSLASPNADDGAIVFEIRGRSVRAAVRSDTTAWLLAEAIDSLLTRVVLAGDLASGSLLTFEVPDRWKADMYELTIVDVANRVGSVRPALDGYKLTIVR